MNVLDKLVQVLPESYLYSKFYAALSTSASGIFPSSYVGDLYTIDSNYTVDFSDSFKAYMIFNKNLLHFPFEMIDNPTTTIQTMRNGYTTQICYSGISARTMKLKSGISEHFLNTMTTNEVPFYYDAILKELSDIMSGPNLTKALYFYRLVGIHNGPTQTLTTMARFAITSVGPNNYYR